MSGAIVSGVNTLATSPASLCSRARLPSLTAMPAASWPRCCRANRPKNASLGDALAVRGGDAEHAALLVGRRRRVVSTDVTGIASWDVCMRRE